MQQSEGFRCMGTDVRFYDVPVEAARRERAFLEAFAARLSRFRDDSELCALNASPDAVVPASPLLRAAVRAGLWAAETTSGLVDPTVLPALERAGYAESRAYMGTVLSHARSSPVLARALRDAPPRRAARPGTDAAWPSVRVDDSRGVIERPPGLRLDTGGVGKGLAADAVAHRLAGHERFVVDCGGGPVVGGPPPRRGPPRVQGPHPPAGGGGP